MKLFLLMGSALAVCIAASTATVARADDTIYSLYAANQTVYIGMVRHDSVSLRPYACYTGGAGTQWSLLGTSSGLDDNKTIHADQLGGSAYDDTVRVIRSSTAIGGNCAPDSGNWESLNYNGYWLDIDGDGGADTMLGGTSNVSYMYGGAGADSMQGYSTGDVLGEGDGDDLFGDSGGNFDVLYAGDGDDCLDDLSNNAATMNCGSGYDTCQSGDSGDCSCDTTAASCT